MKLRRIAALSLLFAMLTLTSCSSLASAFAQPRYTIDGDYIYFGEYPQTIKADDVTITDKQDSRGYYLGSDGAYYAQATATPWGFGYTFSTKERVTSGEVYYFKVEPIRWRILTTDGETAFILCDKVIDHHAFDTDEEDDYGSNNYADSDIRAWLNGSFYTTAFKRQERKLVLTTKVDNSLASTGKESNAYLCEDTEDKIFLLSYAEVTNPEYGFLTDADEKDWMRCMPASDYARATGAYVDFESNYYENGAYHYDYFGNGYWWLRSPHDNRVDDFACSVKFNGICQSFTAGAPHLGVVPALWIRL